MVIPGAAKGKYISLYSFPFHPYMKIIGHFLLYVLKGSHVKDTGKKKTFKQMGWRCVPTRWRDFPFSKKSYSDWISSKSGKKEKYKKKGNKIKKKRRNVVGRAFVTGARKTWERVDF